MKKTFAYVLSFMMALFLLYPQVSYAIDENSSVSKTSYTNSSGQRVTTTVYTDSNSAMRYDPRYGSTTVSTPKAPKKTYTVDVGSGTRLSETSSSGNGGGSYSGGSSNWSYNPPPPPPCDLTVEEIAPLFGYCGSITITAVKIRSVCTETKYGVLVELSANGQKLAKSATVAANGTATLYFRWRTSNAASEIVKATVNPLSAIPETDYTNNSKQETVALRQLPPIAPPEDQPYYEPVKLVDPIPGENVTDISWVGTDENGNPKEYHARLTIKTALDQTEMKSGYGILCKARVTVVTDCPDGDAVLKAQQVVMYTPESQYTKAVRMESKDNEVWELPVNSTSHYGYRRWYVPVWYPDKKNYTVVVQAFGAMTPGGELKGASASSVWIDGNMYEDDYTYTEYSR